MERMLCEVILPKISELSKRGQVIEKIALKVSRISIEFLNVNNSLENCQMKIERNGNFQQETCEHLEYTS